MKENHDLYRQYVNYMFGAVEASKTVFEVTQEYVINQLKHYGISKMTQKYLQYRKYDRTNDYMLDNTDAMEVYDKHHVNPSYKHMCAVLLEGKY